MLRPYLIRELRIDSALLTLVQDVIGLFVAGGGEPKEEEKKEEAPAEAPAEAAPEEAPEGGKKKKKKKKAKA